jgi:PAS domain S-box-containing protein
MNYQFTLYSWVLILTTITGIVTAFIAYRRHTEYGAVYLALLELAVAEWAFAIAFEAAATDITFKLLWSQVAYLGTVTTPLFYFLFAMKYSRRGRYLTYRNIALLSIVPVLTIAAAATNDLHHWLWTDISINRNNNIAIYGHGPWFWVFVAYSYCLLFAGMISLFLKIFRFTKSYKRRIGTLLIGSVFPFVGNLMYVFGLNPIPGRDWTPVAFLLSGLILTWGIFRLHIFELAPVACNKLMDTMGDGVLVIDAQGRIIVLNPAMQTIIGLPPDQVIGRLAAQVLAYWKKLIEDTRRLDKETQVEAHMGEEGVMHYYDLRFSPLHDRKGRLNGQLIVLRDITRRKQIEEERQRLVHKLQDAISEVKTLSGLLPICSHCKKIRDDQGHWHSVEVYVKDHSDAQFSHGICPDCLRKMYPECVDDG